MCTRITSWLEETFETQLLLGHHWLSDELHKQRLVGVKSHFELLGLYHDNGSCLDITNDIPPEQNSLLQIIQASHPSAAYGTAPVRIL